MRGPLGLVLALVFAIDSMTSLVVIAFGQSYLIETRHAPDSYPAFALGIYGFVKLVSAPMGGWIVDRVRLGLVVGAVYACEAAGLLVILATATANGFLVGIGIASAGIALAWLVTFHALGDAAGPEVRASATSYVGLVSAAATATGFGAAAVIGQFDEWQVAFLLGLVLATVAALLTLRLYPPGLRPGRRQTARHPLLPSGTGDRRRQFTAGAVIFAHFFAVTATISVFGPFVLRSFHLSLLRAGFYLLPAAGAAALSMLVMGRLSRHGRRLGEVATLYALGAAAILAASFVQSPLQLAVVSIPLAVAVGGAQPLLNASLLDVSHSSDDTGTVLGWLFFAEGLGSVAGPILIGIFISAESIRGAVVALAVLEALVVALAGLAARQTRI